MTGWTEALAARKTRRKLAAMRRTVERRALEIAYLWGDVDNSIIMEVDELRDELDARIGEVEALLRGRAETRE